MRKRGIVAAALAAALSAALTVPGAAVAGAQKKDKIDPSARLVFGMNLGGGGFSQRLHPPVMTAICDAVVGNQVFGTLIRRDTKTNKPVPNLAESWEIVDAQTFVVKLRPNLVFQDGTKLDAAAAKESLDRNRAPESRLAPTMAAISSIEAGTDGRTLTFRLSQPVAGVMPLTLAGREGMLSAPSSTDTNPVGAGPFKFDSQTVGQKISLSKNPTYWDAKNVKLGGIDFVHIESAQSGVNSVIAGDLDMIEGAGEANKPAENDKNIEILKQPGADYWKLNINTSRPPFDNVDFRKAINHAIDKAAIARALFGDDAQVATQPFPPTFADQYQEELADMYPYSVKKAKKFLKKSGVQTPVTVQAQLPANNPNFSRFAEIVQAQLKEIGVNVELTPSTNLLNTFFRDKQGDFITTLWPARPDPSVTIQRQFTANQITNTGNNLDPAIGTALQEIQAAETPAAAKAGYRKAVEIIVKNAYEVPVFFPLLSNIHRTWVTSKDWQIYGSCQGVDFSKLAITTAKK